MAEMTVLRDRCKGCALCVSACPQKIIAIRRDVRTPKGYCPAECIEPERCTGCAVCYTMCPDCAIIVKR